MATGNIFFAFCFCNRYIKGYSRIQIGNKDRLERRNNVQKIFHAVSDGLGSQFGVWSYGSGTKFADEKPAQRAKKLKAQITKIGVGRDAKVKIRLNSGQTVRGYVSQIKDNGFVVVSSQSGVATEIQYTDGTKFDREPFKLKRWQGLLISAGVVIGIALIVCRGVCVD